MSTPPPPPSSWPASPPQASTGGGSWWTGGRIATAVAVVLLLMGLSAAGGFVAGAAWSGFSSITGGFVEGEVDGFGEAFGDPFGTDVPGTIGLDVPAASGAPVAPGDQVEGELDGGPVAHELTIRDRSDVTVELTEGDVDTVLVLLDEAGEVVDSDDDGGSGQLSRIEASLPAGTYVVRVQPWSGGSSGHYVLAVD